MEALVVYDSKFGNTEKVAQAIAAGLSERYSVRAVPVSAAVQWTPEQLDLLVVGGPTHKHRMSPQFRAMLDSLPRGSLQGVPAAAFDTRYHMASWLTGSAAKEAARRLKRAGCRLVVPAESFFMARDVPPDGEKGRHDLEQLELGEVERAKDWARRLVARGEEQR